MEIDSWNTFLFENFLESLVSIEIGSFFFIKDEWFDSLWV